VTYEFECKGCNHIFTKRMSMMLAAKTTKCPCCGKRAKRLITGGSGFILKGKGFYQTDYKNKRKDGNKKT